MRSFLLSCLFFIVLGFSNAAYAQFEDGDNMTADSTIYNMGRVVMKKKDVQAVTIKAADLEKMPFTDLKTAISLYFNGVYTMKQNIAYVIDGVMNTDINAYSIYDIDEVTLIQNAATVLNGVNGGETLILIKTKRGGSANYGVTGAGQTNLVQLPASFKRDVELNSPGVKDKNQRAVGNLYHQYYVSGYFNSDVVRVGASADVQHDVFPIFNISSYKNFTSASSNRYKFHGFADAKLGDANTLNINAGILKDQGISNLTLGTPARRAGSGFAEGQNIIYTDFSLTSVITTGLVNKLTGGFQRLRKDATYSYPVRSINSYVAEENISYEAEMGDLTLRPQANFTFRQARSGNNTRLGNVAPTYFQKTGVLTPSLTLSYQNFLTVQGGFQTYLNSNDKATVLDHEQTTPLPYVSLSVNPFDAMDVDTDEMRLTVFGSYARDFSNPSDLSGKLTEDYIRDVNGSTVGNRTFANATDPYQIFTQIQGGVNYSVLENSLSFNYNYSLRRFSSPDIWIVLLPSTRTFNSNSKARLELHRAGIDFKLPTDDEDFSWRTGLNGTLLIMRDNDYEPHYVPELMRLVYPGKPFITGGFNNHLSYKGVYLDFSILYCTNQAVTAIGLNYSTGDNYLLYHYTSMLQTFDLQNVDIGYKIPYNRFKNLEVYVNARNLFQNYQSSFVEPRNYIGGGFKVEL